MSVYSSQEAELLGSPSSQVLSQEITESQVTHQKLLDFSQQSTSLILPEDQDHTEMEPTEIPLPPQTEQEVRNLSQPSTSSGGWGEEQNLTLQENKLFHRNMVSILEEMEKLLTI